MDSVVILFLYIFSFFLGTIIGSFLNVIIYRINTGKSIGGRSQCFSCSKTLGMLELIPIVSFIAQLGKCIMCKSRISIQYPIVELISGVIFLLLANKFLFSSYIDYVTISEFVFFAIVFSILIVISAYDIKHKIIPNNLVYAFIIFSVLFSIYDYVAQGQIFHILDFFIGPVLYLFFASIWFVSNGRWMGLGDAKLSLGIGFLLGWPDALYSTVVSFWVASVVSMALLLLQHKYFTLKSEIPLAPFLVFGTFLVFFFNIDISNIWPI